MITYQIEPWSTIKEEIKSLINDHWEEVAPYRSHIPLNVRWDVYDGLEKDGYMWCLAVRDRGKLVGYFIGFVKTHLHYADSLTFFTDVYFLTKEYRKGVAGVKLFSEMEKTLKKRGVQRMLVSTKISLDMSKILGRLGFDETERIHMKLL
jgi:GNAT superfamily N-acetyltransferase